MTVHRDQEKGTLLNHQEGVLVQDEISADGAKEQPAPSTYVHQKRVQDRSTNPSLFNTKEFYLYYLIFITCVPYMFKTGHDASSESNPNYEKFKDLLEDGWFGFKMDNSDQQYANFRNNLPILAAVICIYLPLSHLYRRFLVPVTPVKSPHQPLYRAYFFVAFSFIYIYFMHGNSLLKIGAIVSMNYAIAKLGGSSRLMPTATWIFNLGILFLNETYRGYNFTDIHSSLEWLDNNRGMNSRWDVTFNFTMLRLVSFNLDYYWSLRQTREEKQRIDRDRAPATDKERVSTPTFAEDYNFTYYLAFTLYAPLYVAGPIMTFNDFISQLRYPKEVKAKTLRMWFGRLIFCLLTMEFMMHYMHLVAISKRQAWDNNPILQICMIGLFNLVLIWLKLMIIWRFFRFWALVDGIEAPENMIRCVLNNYSALGFWRSWHKSYNLWTLRYIYIPLGGTRYAIYNIWVVFTFVAVWHDINLKLLAWAWLISFFVLPEIIASKIFSKKKASSKGMRIDKYMGKLAALSPFVCRRCSGQHFHDDGGKSGWLQLGSREHDEDAFGSLWVAVRMDDYVLLFLRDLCVRADAV
ncbi:glycerol transporter [Linnemannia gamsii]|uniref:Glycerol transporter n=1 Tax=Linnemannia gamsii TaxID=64522 RepID=A0ABQ7K569_9FUNG|nr:glycerol transporter [Linnemannia gamsii]